MALPVRNEEFEVKSRLNEVFGLEANDICNGLIFRNN